MRAIRTIPIRRVANRPNLFWGGDREMVQVSLLITFVLVVAAQNTYAFVIGLVFWFFALYALRKLAKLQRNAQSATGQLEALQHANQFHSAQAHQLLQLRNMINTEMQANAVFRQAQMDREAQYEASSKQVNNTDLLRKPYNRRH